MGATHVVTGAFGYSGKYITRRLLDQGVRVVTLTNSPNRPNPFKGAVEAKPLAFDRPDELAASLEGAEVLYNTYWVRFDHDDFSHDLAVKNTLSLFEAAKKAGIKRVIHTSITNPSETSPLPYFKGKAVLERALIESGLSYAILRPTVLFGVEDILVNNIAWTLRKFPVFGLFGDGYYQIQPMYVDDFAELAVREALSAQNRVIDAIGPETFTYRELVKTVGDAIGKRRPILSLPPSVSMMFTTMVGKVMNDLVVTPEEMEGLMTNLLVTRSAPAGSTALTDWAKEHADELGKRYASEVGRRRDRTLSYE